MLHRQQHISTISIIMTCLLSLMSSSIFPRSCLSTTNKVMAYTTTISSFVPSTASRCALLSKGSYYKSTSSSSSSSSCRRNISSTTSLFAMLKSSRSNLVMWGEEDALNKQSRPGKCSIYNDVGVRNLIYMVQRYCAIFSTQNCVPNIFTCNIFNTYSHPIIIQLLIGNIK